MKFDKRQMEMGFGGVRIEPALKHDSFFVSVFEGELVQIQKFEVKSDGAFE